MRFRILLCLILLGSPSWAQVPQLDLSQIAGGSRALALGLAQTAASKDLSSIFFNPAGLGNMRTIHYTGMTGTVLQELSYLSAMAAWPGRWGTLGLGYIGTRLADIPITSRGGSGGGTIITQEATANYTISDIHLSYGAALSRIIQAEWAGKVRLGVDTRVISEQVPGRLTKSRLEVGYGFQHVVARPFTWGVVWRPGNVTTGIRLFVPEQLYQLEVFADAVSSPGLPLLLRSGLEWRPVSEMNFRMGWNQRFRSGSLESGMTAGLGLDLSGLLLDYAYHPLGTIQDNAVHFFSLGFELGKILPKQNPVKTVIPAQMVAIPNFVQFNDVTERFWANTPIQYVTALRIMGSETGESFHPAGTVSLAVLRRALQSALNVAVDPGFMPRLPSVLTRREAVRVIVEAVGLRPPKIFAKPFPDVDREDSISGYVAVAKEEGYLEYMSGEPFEGDRFITRAEIAEILSKIPVVKIRIKQFLTGETPTSAPVPEEEVEEEEEKL